MQSRTAGGTFDAGTITLTYADALGGTTASSVFIDTSIVEGVSDWTIVSDTHVVPVNTRSVTIVLDCSRVGGASTDAFFDNIALTLAAPPTCPPDLDCSGVVDFGDLNIILGNWGLSPASYGEGDITGDGAVNFEDLNTVLDLWGDACS